MKKFIVSLFALLLVLSFACLASATEHYTENDGWFVIGGSKNFVWKANKKYNEIDFKKMTVDATLAQEYTEVGIKNNRANSDRQHLRNVTHLIFEFSINCKDRRTFSGREVLYDSSGGHVSSNNGPKGGKAVYGNWEKPFPSTVAYDVMEQWCDYIAKKQKEEGITPAPEGISMYHPGYQPAEPAQKIIKKAKKAKE